MLSYVITAIAAFILAFPVFHFFSRRKYNELEKNEKLQITRANQTERQLHEREIDFLSQRNQLEIEFSEKLKATAEASFHEGKRIQKAQSEIQEKLFSVKISPYVKIVTDTGIIYNEYEAASGYQYQLLINGIPAFPPHIVLERTESIKEINEQTKKVALDFAINSAKNAIDLYLGGHQNFSAIGTEIVEQLKKK